jgi:hypothetical protein
MQLAQPSQEIKDTSLDQKENNGIYYKHIFL